MHSALSKSVLMIISIFFIYFIPGCATTNHYSTHNLIHTEEAFNRLLLGEWKTKSGSTLKLEDGQIISISPSRKAQGYGYHAGELVGKDFRYLGGNKFRYLSKERYRNGRSIWLPAILIVSQNDIHCSIKNHQFRWTLQKRFTPPKPDIAVTITEVPDIFKANETHNVNVQVSNKGGATARGLVARISTDNEPNGLNYPKVIDVGDLIAQLSGNFTFSITSDETFDIESSSTFNVELSDRSGNRSTSSFTINSREQLATSFERGLPPNLFAELNFKDDNGNGILEALEKAELKINIINKGKGKAQGLSITVEDNLNDSCLIIESRYTNVLAPGDNCTVTIPIKAALDIKTSEHKLKINVREHFGYDMDPAYLMLSTYAYQEPKLVFSGLEIEDAGKDTAALIEDGQLQAGELVKIKIVVQNIGQGKVENMVYFVISKDSNIYLENNKGNLGETKPGEVKEFSIFVSPNKRVKTKKQLPLFLSLYEKIGRGSLRDYQLPVVLNQSPPVTKLVKVTPDLESLKMKIARFECKSSKFKIQKGSMIDIKKVSTTSTIRKDSVAVVIGIEKYRELPSAPYATNDANLMKEYFKKIMGVEQVVLYANEEISGYKFDDIFNPDYGDLQKAINKGKTELFVYYSGHGIPNKSGTKVYLFPSDGKIASIEQRGFSMAKFFDYLNKLDAKSVTVILDACFSGGSKASEKIKTKNLVAMKGARMRVEKPWLWYKNFTVINSSKADETSLAYDDAECGLFTYYLCAGLKGKADVNKDSRITLGELKKYVTQNVTDTSKKIRGIQTPEFYGDENKIIVNF